MDNKMMDNKMMYIKLNTFFLGLLTLFASMAVLRLLSGIFLPLALALVFFFMLLPVIEFLQKRLHLPRYISAITLTLSLFTLFYVIFLILSNSIYQFLNYIPRFQQLLMDFIHWLELRYPFIEEWFLTSGMDMARNSWIPVISNFMIRFSNNALSGFLALIFALLFALFLFFEAPLFKKKLITSFNFTDQRLFSMAKDISSRIGSYILIKFSVSLLTAFLTYFVLRLYHLELAGVWAIIVFLLNFIPNLGSIAAVGFIFIFTLLHFELNWWPILTILILNTSIQFTIGNILEPWLQGEGLDLSPLLLLFSLFFWGWLWGIPGMFISYPLMVIVRVVLENFNWTYSIAQIMRSGKVDLSSSKKQKNKR